jgi:NAD(P)-dependent dehydrogenase (short-subunit alcohol dehydrogenase family)
MAVVMITGCSSGFGRAAALAFADAGHTVVATMRHPRSDVMGGGRSNLSVDALDVNDSASRTKAVQRALDRHGRIDVLVNNAGIMAAGPMEEIPESVARQQFETNFWGAYGLIRDMLPSMITNGTGRIVNVTSIGALLTLGYFTMYCATKHALDALTEGLDIELRGFGIRVVSVVPGGYATQLAANRVRSDRPDTRYADAPAAITGWQERISANTDLSPVIHAVVEAATVDHPSSRYLVGGGVARLAATLVTEGERIHAVLGGPTAT